MAQLVLVEGLPGSGPVLPGDEVDRLNRLPVTTFRADVSEGDGDRHHAEVTACVGAHLDRSARPVAPFTV